jgi:hypothetical protein
MILFLLHLFLRVTLKWSLASWFPDQNFACISHIIPLTFYASLFNDLNSIRRRVQNHETPHYEIFCGAL